MAAHDGRNVSLSLRRDHLDGAVSTDPNNTVQVPATCLSQILGGSNESPFQLVADIEGGEAGIILGEQSSMSRCQLAILELHDTLFGGQQVTIEMLRGELHKTHGMKLIASYCPVCAFVRE